jgi:hypothetical protein
MPEAQEQIAFVDESGKFHCACGKTHDRGAMPGNPDVYRCLNCGKFYRVRGVVQMRRCVDADAKD